MSGQQKLTNQKAKTDSMQKGTTKSVEIMATIIHLVSDSQLTYTDTAICYINNLNTCN